jgi:site-specific DNA recombinase
MSEKKRVATYARVAVGLPVSSDAQVGESEAITAQKSEMQDFVSACGWKIVAEFVDIGESGANMDRPGLRAALEAAEEGRLDILLVRDPSRLSRNLTNTIEIFELLEEMGIDLAFANSSDSDFDRLFSPPWRSGTDTINTMSGNLATRHF